MIWVRGVEYGTAARPRRRSWLDRLLFCGDTIDLGGRGTRTCELPARHVGTHSDGQAEWGMP